MREATGRWALGLGAIAALIGAAAQFVGGLFVPRQGVSSFSEIIRYLLVAIPIALVAFGLALGLAYIAGLQVERARPRTPPSDEPPRWGNESIQSAFAGAIVMGLFCVFSALVAVLLNLRFPTTSTGALLGQRAVQTTLLVILGFGMGALGARSRAARTLLDEIAPAAPADSTPPDAPGADTPTEAPASEDIAH
jgi:uncharacterized membrane protein